MTATIQLKHRVTGNAGAPAATGYKVGEVILNFVAKPTPEFWAFDGVKFVQVNPPGASPKVKGMTATVAQNGLPDVFTAFNSAAPTVSPGDIVIYTWNGTAYVYTGPTGSPVNSSTAGQFTALGAAPTWATAAEITGGSVTDHAIAPDQLRAATLKAPSATGGKDDEDKLIRLDANGKIDSGFLTLSGFSFMSADLTGAATGAAQLPASAKEGTVVVNSSATANNMHPSWGVVGNPMVNPGDMLVMDGSGSYHVIANELDLSAYVSKAGDTMVAAAKLQWPGAAGTAGTPGAEDGNVLLDLKGGTIDNAVIDCGTF
jgi:hypothetical protein